MKKTDKTIMFKEAYTKAKKIELLQNLFEIGMTTEIELNEEKEKISKINPQVKEDPNEFLITVGFMAGVSATAQLIGEMGKETHTEALQSVAKMLTI